MNLRVSIILIALQSVAAHSWAGEAGYLAVIKEISSDIERRNQGEIVGVTAISIRIGERELKSLAQIQSLESLLLLDCEIDDGRFAELTRLKMIRVLNVRGSSITGEKVDLGKFKCLERLLLNGCPFSDEAVGRLAGLKLKTLHLGKTRITDGGMKIIGQMKELEYLNLAETSITDFGASRLVELSQLRMLSLRGTAVGDETVRHIAKLKQVELLDLRNTRITDAGLVGLYQMKSLRTVMLAGTPTSHNGRDLLKGALLKVVVAD